MVVGGRCGRGYFYSASEKFMQGRVKFPVALAENGAYLSDIEREETGDGFRGPAMVMRLVEYPPVEFGPSMTGLADLPEKIFALPIRNHG